PVDCVRFAAVGLLGEKPDLIVSGINHGLNLGDDVTYSGTVAAALEGILLGLPAVAVSQQSSEREMGYMPQRHYDFSISARITAETVRELMKNPADDNTLININVPGTNPVGIDVTRLGKRLYRDELKKVERDVDDGRTSYRIYGYEPGMDDQPGTDIGAIARDRISFTPLRLDWTDHGGLDGLRGRDLDRLLEVARG
ncbi:MAG: 5'/3'-nucleotidase SurE, partial [Actinomycetota bacterium]|nr:5'/3'-nucleotidase SurE [Actinomycetota bacterium]